MSVVKGREAENVAGSGVITTDIDSVAIGGRHWLTPRWAVSFDLTHHKQGSIYERQGVRIGLRHRF